MLFIELNTNITHLSLIVSVKLRTVKPFPIVPRLKLKKGSLGSEYFKRYSNALKVRPFFLALLDYLFHLRFFKNLKIPIFQKFHHLKTTFPQIFWLTSFDMDMLVYLQSVNMLKVEVEVKIEVVFAQTDPVRVRSLESYNLFSCCLISTQQMH